MVVVNNKLTATKKAGELLVILIAMAMQRYDTGHIAQWSTFRDSLEATECCHCPGSHHGQRIGMKHTKH